MGTKVVSIDLRYFHPTEEELLPGDQYKAKTKLGGQATYTLAEMCSEMVRAEVVNFRPHQLLKEAGFKVRNQYESMKPTDKIYIAGHRGRSGIDCI